MVVYVDVEALHAMAGLPRDHLLSHTVHIDSGAPNLAAEDLSNSVAGFTMHDTHPKQHAEALPIQPGWLHRLQKG